MLENFIAESFGEVNQSEMFQIAYRESSVSAYMDKVVLCYNGLNYK